MALSSLSVFLVVMKALKFMCFASAEDKKCKFMLNSNLATTADHVGPSEGASERFETHKAKRKQKNPECSSMYTTFTHFPPYINSFSAAESIVCSCCKYFNTCLFQGED